MGEDVADFQSLAPRLGASLADAYARLLSVATLKPSTDAVHILGSTCQYSS